MATLPSPVQVFVRNREGKVWGPIEPQSVQLLMEGGLLEAPLEVSLNGLDFTSPDMVPEFSEVVPKAVWSGVAFDRPKVAPPVLKPVDGSTKPGPPVLQPSTGRPRGAPPGGPIHQPPPPGIAPAVAPAAPPVVAASRPVPGTPGPPPSGPAPGVMGTEEVPREGNLAAISAIKLCGWAAASDANGLFVFALPDRQIEVHFRKGNPERVESSHPSDALATFLEQQGLATKEKLAQADQEKAKFGGELLGALFGLGILNPGSAFAQLGQRATGILLQAFLATQGRFAFDLKELPASQAMPLGNRWAVLSETARRVPLHEVTRRLMDVWQCPVVRANARVDTSDLKLTATETRAFARVDGVRSLEELLRDFPAEADTFQRLVFFLRELEVVSFAPPRVSKAAPPAQTAPSGTAMVPPPPTAAPPKAAAAKAPGAKPSAARPTSAAKPAATAKPAEAAPPAPIDFAAEIKKLRERAATLKDANHFQVLGLTDTADGETVKAAYFKLAKQFHPDTIPPGAPPELAPLKAEIFGAIGEAYGVLGEDATRAQYAADLKSGGLDKIDVQAILGAEEKFQRATVIFKARKYSEALAMFEECIAANPDEGEFYAWRGYAKHILAIDKKKVLVEAQKDLNEALKRNPRCVPAHYFLGMMAKLNGDPGAARKHFQNAVDLDPNHVESQRELRMLAKKG